MDERLKLSFLLNSVNLSSHTLNKLRENNIGLSDLLRSSPDKLKGIITEKSLLKICKNAAFGWAEKEYEDALNLNIKIISYGSADYPKRLYDLSNAPLILYCKGTLKNFTQEKIVAVVGTRKMSTYGKFVAENIGKMCASLNILLVSGAASGIDSASQNACCEAGGITVAVLGTGIDKIYPASNRLLFEKICDKGALMSEFPLRSSGEEWHFPRRNRIVAALCKKLIIVEAPYKSGAMITSRIGLELGKEIWAVPGMINNKNSEGTNQLIFDGAIPYINDATFFSTINNLPISKTEADIKMTDEERQIYIMLKENPSSTVDKIAFSVKMNPADVLKTVALMVSRKLIHMSAPGRYSILAKL